MHLLILKGKGREWGPVYCDYLNLFTHGQAQYTEVYTHDISMVNATLADREYDGYIITGSTDDAHDSAEYVLNLIERVQELHARKAKIVGICFGHQLVGRALGGVTGTSELGWGVGPRHTPLTDSEADQFLMSCARSYDQWQDSLAQELQDKSEGKELSLVPAEASESKKSLHMFYSHQDQVLEPPPGLRCLTGNQHCRYAGFYSPDKTVLTLQGHPEFDADLILLIIDMLNSKGLYKKLGYDESLDDIVSDIQSNYNPPGGQVFSPLLDNMFVGKCIVSLLLPQ